MRSISAFVLPESLEGSIHELVEAIDGEIGDFFVVNLRANEVGFGSHSGLVRVVSVVHAGDILPLPPCVECLPCYASIDLLGTSNNQHDVLDDSYNFSRHACTCPSFDADHDQTHGSWYSSAGIYCKLSSWGLDRCLSGYHCHAGSLV